MSNSENEKQPAEDWHEVRPDRKIICEGQVAVSKMLCNSSRVDDNEIAVTTFELLLLLHHYCKEYVTAYDDSFFTGVSGGEWKKQVDAKQRIDYLGAVLGCEAVDDMFDAVCKECEAETRQHLCPEGLALYEGVISGTVPIDEWQKWNCPWLDE